MCACVRVRVYVCVCVCVLLIGHTIYTWMQVRDMAAVARERSRQTSDVAGATRASEQADARLEELRGNKSVSARIGQVRRASLRVCVFVRRRVPACACAWTCVCVAEGGLSASRPRPTIDACGDPWKRKEPPVYIEPQAGSWPTMDARPSRRTRNTDPHLAQRQGGGRRDSLGPRR